MPNKNIKELNYKIKPYGNEIKKCERCGIKIRKHDKCLKCEILLHDKEYKCKNCRVAHTLRAEMNENLCKECDSIL